MPTAPPGTPAVREIAQRLGPNHRMTVMSGAGISAASGIPTFRGPGGVWGIHRAEDLATPEGFARDPVLVWEWYDWRRQQVAAARPNPAHDVLARWSRSSDHFTLITQNVDGLHERAGARDVVRFHGSIWELRCWNTCTSRVDPWWDETCPLGILPPRCPTCGGMARPGVVWFGEGIDDLVIRRSREATRCDIFLTVGTSVLVYPRHRWSTRRNAGARLQQRSTLSRHRRQTLSICRCAVRPRRYLSRLRLRERLYTLPRNRSSGSDAEKSPAPSSRSTQTGWGHP